jgi:hypothetical protein
MRDSTLDLEDEASFPAGAMQRGTVLVCGVAVFGYALIFAILTCL